MLGHEAAVETMEPETVVETAKTLFFVPEPNMETLRAKVAKIAKRGVKLGFAADAVRIASETPFRSTFEYAKSKVVDMKTGEFPLIGIKNIETEYAVEVNVPVVKLAGWSFLATVAHTTEGNIVSVVPGKTLPEHYRTVESRCDHCGMDRNRRETFVVEHEDGRTAMVGRNCLKDFLGGHDAAKVAEWAEMLGAFAASTFEGGMRIEVTESLLSFLTVTAMMIRVKGWYSRSMVLKYNEEYPERAALTATVSDVNYYLHGTDNNVEKFRAEIGNPIEADTAIAEKAIEWAAEIEPDNDYLHNLRVIARIGVVNRKVSGLAASMIAGHKRATEARVEYESRAAKDAKSEYVGTAGERLKGITVTVEKIITIAGGEWGDKFLTKMRTPDGNIVIWWDSAMAKPIDEGETAVIDATVKAHDLYENVKQTTVLRVKVWTPEEIEKAAAKAAKKAAKATKTKAA